MLIDRNAVTKSTLKGKLLQLISFSVLILLVLASFLTISFNSIRDTTQDVTETKLNQVIANSQTAYDLSRIFSEIDLLSRIFLNRRPDLQQQANQIRQRLFKVETSVNDTRLAQILKTLRGQFDHFVWGFVDVNRLATEVEIADTHIHEQLQQLERLISDMLIRTTAEQQPTHYIDQMLSLATSYRESMLRIRALHFEHKGHFIEGHQQIEVSGNKIVHHLDELLLMLQTITASEPRINNVGLEIERLVWQYRDASLSLDFALAELNNRMLDLQESKQLSLELVNSLQAENAQQTELLASRISHLISSSASYVIAAVFATILVLTLFTAHIIRKHINTPMSQLISGIDGIADGKQTNIQLQREDEWGSIADALNKMKDELKSYYSQIQRSEEKYRLLVENQSDLVIEMDMAGQFQFVSQTFCQTFGKSKDQLIGQHFTTITQPQDKHKIQMHFRELHHDPYQDNFEQQVVTDQGERWLSWHNRAVLSAAGSPQSIIAIGRDVTARKQAEDALERQRRFLRTVIDSVTDPILVLGRDNEILMSNSAADNQYGVHSGIGLPGLASESTPTVVSGDQPYPTLLSEVLELGAPTQALYVHKTDQGQRHHELVASPFEDTHGEIGGIVQVSRDITEKIRSEEKIRFLAHHDALTHLPNRILLRDRFNQAIQYAERAGQKVGVLFLDLDHFKDINDTLGHHIGDLLLKSVVERISASIRKSDTVSRQGGDEFVILIPQIGSSNDPEQVARQILSSMNQALEIEGHQLRTSFSIGISIYPDDGKDFDTLLKNADTAMYAAKKSGRNAYHFYADHLNDHAVERLQINNRLQQALSRDELILYYQPQIDIQSGRLVGLEALVRWQTEDIGLIPPSQFIPYAEESGLIVEIGECALNQACQQINQWHHESGQELVVCVNLSALQLRREGLPKTVAQAIFNNQLRPGQLELELTESMLLTNTKHALSQVKQLKTLGVKLSLDDFGTGYSSLSYLKQIQPNRLKIDRSFVKDLTQDRDDEAIVNAIIQMAHSLNLTVVAEGVETQEQLQWLKQRACDQVQGFYFYKPMPAEAISELLKLEKLSA
ncbi:MAG: EAL domain-containing protein [Motiliproteus sp.]|nr:EAL domain-containing protein [Motiliproteus sp.]MCW9050803.1 EAL domain-containing protein [Motiliproteus sp.]